MHIQTTFSLEAVNNSLNRIAHLMPRFQVACLKSGLRGEEGEGFAEIVAELEETINNAPRTYAQDGLGDAAVAHFHYFRGSCDWWITELDMDGDVHQAFGLADLGHGDGPELGYISLAELVQLTRQVQGLRDRLAR